MNSLMNKILFHNRMKNYILFFTLYIISIFEFILIVVLNNLPNKINYIDFNLAKIVIALTLLLFIFLVVYINMFIIEDSHKQIAIIMMNGKSTYAMTKHIMKRYLTILLFTIILGSISGYIIIEYILKRNMIMSIHINKIEYYQSLYYIMLLFFIKSIYIFMINHGKLRDIRFKLIDYINNISKKEVKVGYFSSFIVEEEKKKFPYIRFGLICLLFIVFIGSLKMIFTQSVNSINFFIGLTGVIFSFLILLKLFIPLLYDFFHKYLLTQKIWIITINDYLKLYKIILPIMSINVIFQPIMIYLMVIINRTQLAMFIFCYFIIQITLTLCCFFRYYSYLNSKKIEIMTLNSLGYTIKNIKKIQHRELITFLSVFIIFPLILILLITIKGNILINYKIILYAIYIIPLCLLYFINKIMINKKIKEIIYYVHEFNRNT